MSIESEILRIQTNISNAYTKMKEKGAVIPTSKNSENLASTIATITSSDGSVITLGQMPEGSIIFLNENSVSTPFYVVQHNYEADINGEGRTLVVRKYGYMEGEWNDGRVYSFTDSLVCSYLNTTYKALLDTDIQQLIGTTYFRATTISSSNDEQMSTLSASVFLLPKHIIAPTEDLETPMDFCLRIMQFGTLVVGQFTSSLVSPSYVYTISKSGEILSKTVGALYCYRPCFTLPSSYISY